MRDISALLLDKSPDTGPQQTVLDILLRLETSTTQECSGLTQNNQEMVYGRGVRLTEQPQCSCSEETSGALVEASMYRESLMDLARDNHGLWFKFAVDARILHMYSQ